MAKSDKTEGKNELVPIVDLFPVLAQDFDAIAQIATENMDGSRASVFNLERIRVPAGGGLSFRLIGEDGTEDEIREFDAVVVFKSRQRAYWQRSLTETGGGTRPDCVSRDCQTGNGDNGDGPGTHSCAACPKAKFGTRIVDGRPTNGQACSEVQLLFVLRSGRDGAIFPSMLVCPPGSLRNIQRWLFAMTGAAVPFYGAMARFSLEKLQSESGIGYSAVKVSTVRKLSPEDRAKAQAYGKAMAATFLQVADATVEHEDLGG